MPGRKRVSEALCRHAAVCELRLVPECPQNVAISGKAGDVWAAVSFDDEIRQDSSSGGVFSELAQWVLEQSGIVFGAAYNDNMEVVHTEIRTMAELPRLRGSKYVQSRIGETYAQARAYLDQGRWVLFSGTPCQIAGLKAYLQKEYTQLLCVDILCHGVPSPAVFRKYVHELERENGKKLVDFRFRSKKTGWKRFSTELVFQDGQRTVLAQDGYMNGFLQNLYLRESCHQCRYASRERVGDITLGDYWGYQSRFPRYLLDDDNGVSLVIVNTEQGQYVMNCIRNGIAMVPRTIQDAQRGNKVLQQAFPKPEKAERFWKDFDQISWAELNRIYFSVDNWLQEKIIGNDRMKSVPYKTKNRKHIVHSWMAGVWRKIRGK